MTISQRFANAQNHQSGESPAEQEKFYPATLEAGAVADRTLAGDWEDGDAAGRMLTGEDQKSGAPLAGENQTRFYSYQNGSENWCFTGKPREDAGDLFGARFYQYHHARWLSPDQPFADQYVAAPQSWNLYAYVRNNPLNYFDEDGAQGKDSKIKEWLWTGFEYAAGVSRGVINSVTQGRYGQPSAYDPPVLRKGHEAGSLAVMAAGATGIAKGVITMLGGGTAAGGGLALAPETGGISLVATAGGAGVAAIGAVEVVLGGALINGSLISLNQLKSTEAKGAGSEGKAPFNFTETAARHMSEPGRQIPIQTLEEILKEPLAITKDPQGTSAMMNYGQMWKNGRLYNVEILYDKSTNTILHFKYTRDATGPLGAISR